MLRNFRCPHLSPGLIAHSMSEALVLTGYINRTRRAARTNLRHRCTTRSLLELPFHCELMSLLSYLSSRRDVQEEVARHWTQMA
jgi:hypothetical protein